MNEAKELGKKPNIVSLLDEQGDASCSICTEEYKEPAILRCGHVFCEGCLDDHTKAFQTQYLKKIGADASNIPHAACPLCATSIPPNSILRGPLVSALILRIAALEKNHQEETQELRSKNKSLVEKCGTLEETFSKERTTYEAYIDQIHQAANRQIQAARGQRPAGPQIEQLQKEYQIASAALGYVMKENQHLKGTNETLMDAFEQHATGVNELKEESYKSAEVLDSTLQQYFQVAADLQKENAQLKTGWHRANIKINNQKEELSNTRQSLENWKKEKKTLEATNQKLKEQKSKKSKKQIDKATTSLNETITRQTTELEKAQQLIKELQATNAAQQEKLNQLEGKVTPSGQQDIAVVATIGPANQTNAPNVANQMASQKSDIAQNIAQILHATHMDEAKHEHEDKGEEALSEDSDTIEEKSADDSQPSSSEKRVHINLSSPSSSSSSSNTASENNIATKLTQDSLTAAPKNMEPLPGLDCEGKNNIPHNREENCDSPLGLEDTLSEEAKQLVASLHISIMGKDRSAIKSILNKASKNTLKELTKINLQTLPCGAQIYEHVVSQLASYYDRNAELIESVALYEHAANQGCGLAQFRLGRIYQFGEFGKKKNDNEAVRLYRLATSNGYSAYTLLFKYYITDTGIDPALKNALTNGVKDLSCFKDYLTNIFNAHTHANKGRLKYNLYADISLQIMAIGRTDVAPDFKPNPQKLLKQFYFEFILSADAITDHTLSIHECLMGKLTVLNGEPIDREIGSDAQKIEDLKERGKEIIAEIEKLSSPDRNLLTQKTAAQYKQTVTEFYWELGKQHEKEKKKTTLSLYKFTHELGDIRGTHELKRCFDNNIFRKEAKKWYDRNKPLQKQINSAAPAHVAPKEKALTANATPSPDFDDKLAGTQTQNKLPIANVPKVQSGAVQNRNLLLDDGDQEDKKNQESSQDEQDRIKGLFEALSKGGPHNPAGFFMSAFNQYGRKENTKADDALLSAFYENAFKGNDAATSSILQALYEGNINPNDFEDFSHIAVMEMGDKEKQYNFGMQYLSGISGSGVKQAEDDMKGVKLLRKSASSGYPNAQYALGLFLLTEGEGAKPQDQQHAEGMQLLESAKNQGYAKAQSWFNNLPPSEDLTSIRTHARDMLNRELAAEREKIKEDESRMPQPPVAAPRSATSQFGQPLQRSHSHAAATKTVHTKRN